MAYTRKEYLKWKRQNVTLRGVKDRHQTNGVYPSFGSGLYTAHLSNRAMAKQYGKVYFVMGARPSNPYKFQYLGNVKQFRHEHGGGDGEKMREYLLANGFDGIEIPGREMVNYTPPDDIRMFETERELEAFYRDYIHGTDQDIRPKSAL